MRKQITNIIVVVAIAASTLSCSDFLKETPKTFLSPNDYFNTQDQMQASVNGLYTFLDDIFSGDIEVATARYGFLEYMVGYGIRPRSATTIYFNQAKLLTVSEENNNLEEFWRTGYFAIENCNSVIGGIEAATIDVPEDIKNMLLGETYFLRAYYYFNLVRMFGDVPLKTSATIDLSDVQLPLNSIEEVYAQIEADLIQAETLMANVAWSKSDGHVGKGAVKSLLAKVYITMAGYPLQKGNAYFEKAYTKAKEVVNSQAFALFSTYADLRNPANANMGEFIFSIQREADRAGSPVHNDMLPYPSPSKEISANSAFGGGLAPTIEFYNSYAEDDARRAERGFFYTSYPAKDGSGDVDLGSPFIFKYWDNDCASSGKSGMNYPLIRFADVLLIMAEAKAQVDGGTTSDAAAIDAWYQVRHRAMPAESKPTSITFDDVYKERIWELCFETQTWFDMLRTRKALNTRSGKIVDLIGYQTPGHEAPFAEKDLLFPYPLREKRLNPNLVRQ